MDLIMTEDFFIQHNLPLYFQYREEIQSGDLLQWRSETRIGGSIRFFRAFKIFVAGLYRGKWHWPKIRDNHSSQAIKGPYQNKGIRRWHGEALQRGIEAGKLSDRLYDHKGKVWLHRLKQEHDEGGEDAGQSDSGEKEETQ